MVRLTITVDNQKHAKDLTKMLKEIRFVQEVKTEINTKKDNLLKKISVGLKEVKAARDGKIKLNTLDDLLNEISD